MTVCAVLAAVLALLLNLPWALEWTWADVTGARPPGASGRSTAELATLAPDTLRFGFLALALYVPVLAALAISRAWRLTWSARGAALVVAFGTLMLFADRGALDFSVPRTALLAAPIALGLALNAAALAGGFASDVLSRGFGWRQPVGILGHAAIVVGIVPAVLAIGDGAWNTPDTPITTFLSSQLPLDPAAGDYRVLYVGDPRVLPVPGPRVRAGHRLRRRRRRSVRLRRSLPGAPHSCRRCRSTEALQLVADGSTLRAGRLARTARHPLRRRARDRRRELHGRGSDPGSGGSRTRTAEPARHRFGAGPARDRSVRQRVVVPRRRPAVGSDCRRVEVGRCRFARACRPQPRRTGDDRRRRLAVGDRRRHRRRAAPGDPVRRDGCTSLVNGKDVASRPSFGVETAFDVDTGGPSVLAYEREASRSLWLAVQAVLWIAVLAVGVGAQASFVRRTGGDRVRRDADRPDWRAPDFGRCRR